MRWLTEHAAQLTLALVGVLVAVAIANASVQGANAERLVQISRDLDEAALERVKLAESVSDLSDEIDSFKAAIEARIGDLQQNIDAQALDIPGILFSQGLVKKGDVLTAAVINGDLWVIPDDATLARYVDQGAEVESISNLISGIRVPPVDPP